MKRIDFFRVLMAVALGGLLFSSCKKNKDILPSSEFAAYVSAYTGGVIGSDASVRIELAQEQPVVETGVEIEKPLFTFSPAVRGKAWWVNNRTIEFVPDSGALSPGTLYRASFALGKVQATDKKLANFEFSFRVEEHGFKLKINSLEVDAADTKKVSVHGEIRFSFAPDPAGVAQMMEARRGSEKFTPVIEATKDNRMFRFTVSSVEKKTETTKLVVRASGKALNINKTMTEEVELPASDVFKLLSVELVDEPDYGARLTFSDPVSDTQDLNGLVGLAGATSNLPYTSVTDKNLVYLFFDRFGNETTLSVKVDEGLKNTEGKSLDKSSEILIETGMIRIPPQVEILSSGTIMPDSKNLLLTFRAVNLYAVDVSVIRIFSNNILMFLQDNSFGETSDYSLRRSGRMIYKQTIRLDNDPTKNIHNWENYSLDLSDLIEQEPGAFYRVRFSFKQAYSAYPCDADNQPAKPQKPEDKNQLTKVTAGNLSEKEEAQWDMPESYYYFYDEDADWSVYSWEEVDNPCDPSYYMSRRAQSVNVFASNIGLIVKGNANNQIWVAVTDLTDTKPLANMEITAYNFQLQPVGTGRTDRNGFATMQLNGKPFVVVASDGNRKGYLKVTDGAENMLSRFDVGGKETGKGLKGYLYGERGVWRPGDTLHLSFMLEDRERRIPDHHPVSLELYNPLGQFAYKKVSTNGLNGIYVFEVPTGENDPTGVWSAYIKVGGTSFYKALRIEAIKPNRLKINLKLPGDMLYSTDGNIPVTLSSAWLTGATARNLDAKVEMTFSRMQTQFKGYEKYLFNNPATDFSQWSKTAFRNKLNDEGEATFQIPVPEAKNAPGMLRLNLYCEVAESGGNVSMHSQSVTYSPYSSYIGINFNSDERKSYFETDKENVFDVVTLDPKGHPVGRSALEYKIYRVNWSWWWEHNNESFVSYLQDASIRPVATGELKTVDGKAQIKFRVNYPEWGRYLVYVKDKESGHATGGTVYVDWPEWRGRSDKSDPDNVKMLTFSLNKTTYEVGEEATVIIPSPAGGRALVAIENGSEVVSREWVSLSSGDTKYTFRVTESMSPNVYVHISLLQPHNQTANDLPIRMYGVMPVFVSNKNSVLQPQITMADVLHPEAEFSVKVKEATGKPMTYTLAIVDDGLLDLTNFKTPDPWNEFYAREALGIRTWDLYDYVMGSFAGRFGSILGIGGDAFAENAGNEKANRFKPVVKFMGPFALRKGEEKTHKLTLPPYIGSVRVMVVAGQEGAYGKAEKTVPVRSPLMLLATLPRVVSIHEEIALPVNIFAMENSVKNVTVKVETTGKLQPVNGHTQQIAFNAPGDQVIYFNLKSGMTTGMEKVTVTATGNGQVSKETIEIQVRNPNPPVTEVRSKLLNPGETGDFAYHLDGSFEGNWVKLEVSRIPSVDISRRFDFLYDYPHCCTEQLTSRALPLLFIPLFKDLDDGEADMIKKNVQAAIADLYGRQLSNGGFAYWPSDNYENEWITSYAGSFLLMAKEKGYEVNAGVLSRWKKYQRTLAQNWRKDTRRTGRYLYDMSDLTQAERLYTLALAGASEMGAMNRLKEAKDLSQQAKWRLAAAYALAGNQKAAEALIFNEPKEVSSYSLNNNTFGSYDRDEAMILETLVLMGRDKEAFTQAVRVSRNLSQESYFTTQSTACSLIAMGRFAEKMTGSLDFTWTLNGAKQGVKSPKAVFQREIPEKPEKGAVTVENTGNGVIYALLTSKTKPVNDLMPSLANNIRLEVAYQDMNGAPIDVTRLKQGTDFMAVIKVTNISPSEYFNDLSLTQIIPSGWEIFNERMNTPDSPNQAQPFLYQDIRDDRVLTYFDLGHSQAKILKVRLRASYAGDFVFPAILCEGMYNTNVQARTTAGRAIVEK
jgi:uncharacterized protein YfaS (alpha-2-macroglobulin family)